MMRRRASTVFLRCSPTLAVFLIAACTAFPESLLSTIDGGTAPTAVDGSPGGADASAEADGDTPATPDAGTPVSRYAAAVSKDEPVMYLRLGEDIAAPNALDETGQHSGTYAGLVTYGVTGVLEDDPNTAISTTNGSGHIVVPTGLPFDGPHPFTLEVWVRPDAGSTGIRYIIDHERFDAVRQGWGLFLSDGAVHLERWIDNSTADVVMTATPLTEATWHRIVAVFDGSQQYLYVDDQSPVSAGSTRSLPVVDGGFFIGCQNGGCGSNTAFRGALDEIAIYDKALGIQQIQAHWNAAR